MRRFALVIAVLVTALAVFFWFRARPAERVAKISAPASTPPTPASNEGKHPPEGLSAPTWSKPWANDFPIAAMLNAPDGTITQDIEALRLLFEAWRTNFPREGNPVGENQEITAALRGKNSLELALIPPDHPALNGEGELCDRWGTPFRFHQLSGEMMGVKSAGPDRKFRTEDDVTWTPEEAGSQVLRE